MAQAPWVDDAIILITSRHSASSISRSHKMIGALVCSNRNQASPHVTENCIFQLCWTDALMSRLRSGSFTPKAITEIVGNAEPFARDDVCA